MTELCTIFIAIGCIFVLFGCDSLVSRFAFFPDTDYALPTESLPDNVREIYINTRDGAKLQCYYIQHPQSHHLLIYFHGNAGNIAHRLPDLIRISNFGIHVLGVGYRGYGKSLGKPSEKGIYLDGEGALKYATDILKFRYDKIILMGRSIGSTVAVYTGQHLPLNGMILVSPLTSGKDHAKAHGFGPFSVLAGKSFDNLARISNIKCPLLILHGSRDAIIPMDMGKSLYEKARADKAFVLIDGAGHNDLSDLPESKYWQSVGEFIKRQNRLGAGGTAIR